MQTYDSTQHILLRDAAHQRCIHQEGEVKEYVRRVKKAGYEVIAVQCPDWPPVKRTPLPIIVFGISVDGSGGGGSSMGGPTADMTWEGEQLAVACNRGDGRTYEDYIAERTVRDIARAMAPSSFEPAHRMAYAWQVAEFDPQEHVVIRYWCRRNNVDIVDFWRGFYPEVEDLLTVIETTNPEIAEERAEGSYSPTRRSIPRWQLYLLRNHYLGANEGPPEPEGSKSTPALAPQPRSVHDSEEATEEQVVWDIHQGAHAYEPHEVMPVLETALGRDARLFSGTTMDSRIVAISREAMVRYLAANPVDQRQYIRDSGGRNYDCDDFAFTLRSNLIRDHGYNACAVIAGDVHAFNAFILAGEHGPEVAFVEPQTDGLVTALEGQYSVDRRCEVLI